MNKRQKILNGWILYSNRDSGINMHYVNLYRKACEKRGMNVRFGVYDPELLSAGLKACQIEGEAEKDLPQFVINRTRDDQLAERLESYGIHVFNSSFLTRLGNDKSGSISLHATEKCSYHAYDLWIASTAALVSGSCEIL